MKARKITIGILASILTLNTFAQSADSASVGMGAVNAMTGQVTAPVWVDPGLTNVELNQVAGVINANNVLINNLLSSELAKRDAQFADLLKKYNSLKASLPSTTCMYPPYGAMTSETVNYPEEGMPEGSSFYTSRTRQSWQCRTAKWVVTGQS